MPCTINVEPYVDEYSGLHLRGYVECSPLGWFRVVVRYNDGHEVVFPYISGYAREHYKCLREAGSAIPVAGRTSFDYVFTLLPGFPRPVAARVEAVDEKGEKEELDVDLSRYTPRYKWARTVYVVSPTGATRPVTVRTGREVYEAVSPPRRTSIVHTAVSKKEIVRPQPVAPPAAENTETTVTAPARLLERRRERTPGVERRWLAIAL